METLTMMIFVLLFIQIAHSFHHKHYHIYHKFKSHQVYSNRNNDNYNTNDIPLTFQSKLSSSLLSTSKVSLALLSLRLIRPNKVNAVDIATLTECSDSIVLFQGPNRKDIIMIGTAHISEDSANLVKRTVRTIKPDLVMIELDLKRIGKFDGNNDYDKDKLREAGFILPVDDDNNNNRDSKNALSSLSSSTSSTSSSLSSPPSSPSSSSSSVYNQQKKQVNGFRSIVSGWASKLGGLLLGKALGQFYNSIEKLGFNTGGEFKAAIEEGRLIGSKILLGDRDVEVTLQRLAKAISLTSSESFTSLGDKIEVLQNSIGITDLDSIIDDKEVALSAIERMKQRDTLNEILSVVKNEVPLVYSALIGERDEYMANSIANAKGNVALGVVGMAHLNGIEKYLIQKGYSVVKRNCPTNPKIL